MNRSTVAYLRFLLAACACSVIPCALITAGAYSDAAVERAFSEQRPLMPVPSPTPETWSVGIAPGRMPSEGGAQGVRPERSPSAYTASVVLEKAGGDRSLRELATNAAKLCGVPATLFHSLIERESSWNPAALSSSGAVGLAQVKPSTARGVSPTLDVYTPWGNLVAGACYLRQMRDRFGSWSRALHAYHGGPTALDAGKVSAASVRYAAQISKESN